MNESRHLSPPPTPLAEAISTVAALFGAPLAKSDLIEILRSPDASALAPLARFDSVRPVIAPALAAINEIDPDDAVSLLNRTFCRLFLGAGGPMSAPPYESAYQGSGRLYQEPAGEMTLLLQRRGRCIVEGFREPADHLVIELTLLSEALDLAATTGNAEDIETAQLLLVRLRRWVPDFTAACQTHDSIGFYAAIAMSLERLLNEVTPETTTRA